MFIGLYFDSFLFPFNISAELEFANHYQNVSEVSCEGYSILIKMGFIRKEKFLNLQSVENGWGNGKFGSGVICFIGFFSLSHISYSFSQYNYDIKGLR